MQVRRMTIRKPDDLHVHIRDGEMMRTVLPYTARDFSRAVIMPNLAPDVVNTTERMLAYRKRIISALGMNSSFTPLMTLYLTEDLSVEEIEKANDTGLLIGIKFYPRGATTNSAQGVRKFENVAVQLEAMARLGVPLLVHGEDNLDDNDILIDPFDKERVFIENTLPEVQKRHPSLRIVLEHITTEDAADYVLRNGGPFLAATITPHHLVCDRRDLFRDGLNPHFFCLPVLKREADMRALRELVASGFPFAFAGTDSAPHPTHAKERGCFVAPVALSMYAQVFEEEDALRHFESFMSEFGAKWYGLPLNEGTTTLIRGDEAWAPEELAGGLRYTEVERKILNPSNPDGIRPFGMHDNPSKSMKWHWQVLRT
jgi:dihydroorotase